MLDDGSVSWYFFPTVDTVIDFYRAMLCMRGICYGPVSVCLCLSHVGVQLKRLKKDHTNKTTR